MASIITSNVSLGNDSRIGTNAFLTIKVAGHPDIVIQPSEFSDAIIEQAIMHGLEAKIVDAAALSVDADTGRSATPADKFYAMRDVVAQLTHGDWNKRATGDGTASAGLLVAALIRVTGKSKADVEAIVAGWNPEQQGAMRARADVAPVIAAIKAERAAGKGGNKAPVDTDGLFAALMPVAVTPDAAPVAKTKGKKA